MKLQHLFFALSLSITSVAALRQEEPPAEKVYKNIKSLTGVPASEVIPSMKFMSASLKVDCEFCHKGDDFASDEKSEKNATRHMIEMQKDINTKNFRGRTQVTCYTCHNGSPSPQRNPSLADMSRRTVDRRAAAAVPADVIKKYLTAVGDDLKTASFTGTAKGFGPAPTPISMTHGLPNKFVSEFDGRKFGFDGTVTWLVAGGQTMQLPADQAKSVQGFARYFRSEQAFAALGDLRFAGRDKIAGKEVIVLRSGAQGAKVSEDLYFDATSGLLVRIGTYTTTILGSLPESTDFSDYRKVGNTMVPFKTSHTGGKEVQEIIIEKATANPKLDDNFFTMPKGASAK